MTKSLPPKSFVKIEDVLDVPNLVQIQLSSYEDFLQMNQSKTRRANKGLQAVFKDVFPIESYDGKARLEFVYYSLDKPKYTLEECRKRDMTYASPLKIKVRLVTPEDIKEQEVYIGDLPLMTKTGTFIINGAERVVVSQLHRSPGVCFEESIHPTGRRLFNARIIPYRGSWLEIEFDINDLMYVYIDRRRKFLLTTFLKALGYSRDTDILKLFYTEQTVATDAFKAAVGKVLAADLIDSSTGEIIGRCAERIGRETLRKAIQANIKQIKIIDIEKEDPSIANTLARDYCHSQEEALIEIYRRLRPGDPPNLESAKNLIRQFFFEPKRYNLGNVGRFVLNRKLGMNVPLSETTLDKETIINVIKYLIGLKRGEGVSDDIDHLGNRRVRSVGELLSDQFRIGLARMERTAKERMNIYDLKTALPYNLINSKLISSAIWEFFGRSQLSQFMDQTNPLAELTHKRRLSALGPGGLSRERAGFEVRDVHPSHYGRICPIETPEGPNIGLIASLSTYARVNELGFLETPYRKVIQGRVTEKIEYLSADVEDRYIIAQANTSLDKSGRFTAERISARYKGDFPKVSPDKIDYMDVSPKQLVSVAASLIPFLEHDDANRALMGSNMQRQAVPLLVTEAPLVATGMEKKAAQDSGVVITAERSGVVKRVTADEIVVDNTTYRLRKFERSNAGTCINQQPIVKEGQRVKKGEVIADGPATRDGQLALGRNVLVAFMPWRGYNFEDAILISEKIVKEDIYTSIHIEEFEIEARETKLGNEEITRDIPNIGEESLSNLGKDGIVRIGAEVGPGDILVGKVTPKSETELSPEERLLRAIFGEKAHDVRDASLVVPPGVEGVVIDVKVFSRKKGRPKSKEEKQKEASRLEEVHTYYQEQIKELIRERQKRLAELLVGQKLEQDLLDEEGQKVLIPADKKISKMDCSKIPEADIEDLKISNNPELSETVKQIVRLMGSQIEDLVIEEDREIERIRRGDELPLGVLKKVKVYVATKRKLSVGDKMAGRHGNKGVIAKILPEEDMPFLPDGTPVEIVLNPLGVPSRMNVGQILETHLGWAARVLGFQAISPVFSGATESEIKAELVKAGLPEDGKTTLYDGRTGEPFDQRVTVGYIYMMKLAHLVDEKIHARSIGPYSLVTQQPLGGKAQFGGQRLGEMEVWALEAYGAAYTLQELLTVKSDDVTGRTRIYEAIVKGENALQPGTPESFNVLIKELQSLGLDIRPEKKKKK